MPVNISAATQIEFDEMVHQVYQAQGFKLRGLVRTHRDVVGSTDQFRIMSKGLAKRHVPGNDADPMNLAVTVRTATLLGWEAVEYSDIFLQKEVNFDQQSELAKAVGMAIGRRFDQINIDALNASATTNTIADGGTGMTYDKVRETAQFLDAAGVPHDSRVFVLSAKAAADLLNDDKFTSSDFINQRTVMTGSLDGVKIYGFQFCIIPDMAEEGGLPLASTIRTNFAYDKDALGMAISMDFSTRIDYIPRKFEHQVAGLFQGGAVAIDDLGIVKIDTDEAA